jgi:ABC-type transport system involved in Fe-S cluster assembly fused permease/ATPase subunit
MALKWAKSDGCFEWLRRWLSYPIEDYGYKALSKGTQAHVMRLSSDFHTSKGAKKIFFAAYRGKNILELVDTVGFQVISMFIDLTLIFGYLIYVFGPYMALNLVVTALAYLYITSKLTVLANGTLEERNMCHVKEWEVLQSTFSNWEIAAVSPSVISFILV